MFVGDNCPQWFRAVAHNWFRAVAHKVPVTLTHTTGSCLVRWASDQVSRRWYVLVRCGKWVVERCRAGRGRASRRRRSMQSTKTNSRRNPRAHHTTLGRPDGRSNYPHTGSLSLSVTLQPPPVCRHAVDRLDQRVCGHHQHILPVIPCPLRTAITQYIHTVSQIESSSKVSHSTRSAGRADKSTTPRLRSYLLPRWLQTTEMGHGTMVRSGSRTQAKSSGGGSTGVKYTVYDPCPPSADRRQRREEREAAETRRGSGSTTDTISSAIPSAIPEELKASYVVSAPLAKAQADLLTSLTQYRIPAAHERIRT